MVALRSVRALALAQAPQVPHDLGQQARPIPLQLPQALAGHRPRLPVRPVVRPIDDGQQQFDQARDVPSAALLLEAVHHGDEDRGGGHHHLLLERVRGEGRIGGRLDDGAEGLHEAAQEVGAEEGVGGLLEEDEEGVLEGEREVAAEDGGDGEVGDGGGGGGVAAVLEVLDEGLPLLRGEGLRRRPVAGHGRRRWRRSS